MSHEETEAKVRQVVEDLLPQLDAILAERGYRRVTELSCDAGPAEKLDPEGVILQVRLAFVPKESETLLVLS